MLKHNLEFPRFYSRLYALISLEALQGAHRSEFASELQVLPDPVTSMRPSLRLIPPFAAQLLLSSSGLPDYMLAAFAKRLARLALYSTPGSAALACGLIFNAMLRHPSVRVLINRPLGTPAPMASAKLSATPTAMELAGSADPFLPDEAEPEKSRAIESCLWEVETLKSHYCPTVSSLAALFAKPIEKNTHPIDLAPLSELSYSSLAELEIPRRPKEVPTAIYQPVTLFGSGAHPARAQTHEDAGLEMWL